MKYHDIECPYCEHGLEINHDDGYGYEEGIKYQQQCDNCNKYFTYTTSISYYYEAEQADCLNGQDHIWEPTRTYPRCFTKMECTICEERREPTDEEREMYSLPRTWTEEIENNKGKNGEIKG